MPPVKALSDSDGELDELGEGLPPVSLLSDSDVDSHEAEDICLEPPKRKRKRKRNASKPPLAERLKSTVNLEKLVGRPCKRCGQGCLKRFSFVSKFRELTAYREHWCDLHKIDQDQLVARLLLVKPNTTYMTPLPGTPDIGNCLVPVNMLLLKFWLSSLKLVRVVCGCVVVRFHDWRHSSLHVTEGRSKGSVAVLIYQDD